MLSCEFCGISKNTFFTEHLWAIASVLRLRVAQMNKLLRNINPKKTTGVDKTPLKLVKLAANVLSQQSEATNKSLSTGTHVIFL